MLPASELRARGKPWSWDRGASGEVSRTREVVEVNLRVTNESVEAGGKISSLYNQMIDRGQVNLSIVQMSKRPEIWHLVLRTRPSKTFRRRRPVLARP